jgi:hypothetical protein
VPAIWLLELDKVDRRLRAREEAKNITAFSIEDLRGLGKIMGVSAQALKLLTLHRRNPVYVTASFLQGHLLPHDLQIDTETWVTVIEQFLMLILIIGRWMLPKGQYRTKRNL